MTWCEKEVPESPGPPPFFLDVGSSRLGSPPKRVTFGWVCDVCLSRLWSMAIQAGSSLVPKLIWRVGASGRGGKPRLGDSLTGGLLGEKTQGREGSVSS